MPAHTPAIFPSEGKRRSGRDARSPTAAPQKRQKAESTSTSLRHRAQVMTHPLRNVSTRRYGGDSGSGSALLESAQNVPEPALDLVPKAPLEGGRGVDRQPGSREGAPNPGRQHDSLPLKRVPAQVGPSLRRQGLGKR